MLPERWNEIKQKLHFALDLASERRAAYVAEIAASDPELGSELESLLISHAQAGTDFLHPPTTAPTAMMESLASREPLLGKRLGPYQVEEQIGSGGMGEVYRAFRADDQYNKQVAIKLVRAGRDSGLVISRFRNERQILASLDHPNIARLLDGGTTESGVPYLVMELIAGQPIDDYCQSHQLSIAERLRLFLQVCSAVQYAHQRLIIHRDIKPGNIFVTSDGVPKLLDFGVAKILDAGPLGDYFEPTMTVFSMLTPGYASPEQVKGDAITTASDVYSLGVVLYELLTGCSPYKVDSHAPHEITRAVCEYEPEKPSTRVRREAGAASGRQPTTDSAGSSVRDGSAQRLSRHLRGDLDNIILMALRKEPQRRYASVEQFAGDVRRHLEDLPVLARADTLGYRTSKFVIRHRAGVAAVVAVVITLIVGLIVTLREARIARQQAEIAHAQRARAERRFNDVRKLANSLMFELHDSIRDLPGSTPARKLLVTRALEYLDSLNQEAKGDPSLQQELAEAYERVGDVQGQAKQANLGDAAGAAASYKKALAIREQLAAADPKDMDVRRALVPNYGKLSDLLWSTGDEAGCMENSRKALATMQTLSANDAANPVNRRLLALIYLDFGYKQAQVADDRLAGLESLQRGTTILEGLVASDPQNARLRRALGLGYSREAEVLADDPRRQSESLALYRKALNLQKALSDADPTNAELRRLAAYGQYELGQLLARMGDNAGALREDRAALAVFRELSDRDPKNLEFRGDVGQVQGDIGQILVTTGDAPHAVELLRQSVGALEKMPGAREPTSLSGSALATAQLWMGKAYAMMASAENTSTAQKRKFCREATSWLQKCRPAWEALRDRGTPRYEGAARVSEIQRELAHCKTFVSQK